MIRHFLKTALRIFYRRKLYSLISLSGLILAFTVSFLILIYAVNELQINREFVNYSKIYRVINTINSTSTISALTVKGLGPQIENSIHEIAGITRLTASPRGVKIKIGDQFVDANSIFVDNDFFKMFENGGGIPGDMSFTDPYSIIISKRIADQISPGSPMEGESLELKVYNKDTQVRVIKVIDGFSEESILEAQLFLSMELFSKTNDNPLLDFHPFFHTFIMVDDQSLLPNIQVGLDKMDKDHFDDLKMSRFSLQPFSDFYLDSGRLSNHHYPTGDKSKIQLFMVVSSLLLLIAMINFTILATANALYRKKEYGIRKSFGSDRRLLSIQTLSESLIMALVALPISIIFTELLLPFANDFWGKQLDFHLFRNWPFVIIFLLLSILIGLISGAYLSFHISRLNPTLILTPSSRKKGGFSIRHGLIVVQIFIFVALTSFSLLVLKQMNYFQSKPLGYQSEGLIVPQLVKKEFAKSKGINPLRVESFINELKDNPMIIEGSYFAIDVPPFRDATNSGGLATLEQPNDIKIFIPLYGDQGTIQTLGLKLKEGRNFSKGRYDEILLTETGAKHLGIEDPIGKLIKEDLEIIGIIEDFHSQSFRRDMGPLYIKQNNPDHLEEFSLRLNFAFRFNTDDTADIFHIMKKGVERHFPEYDYKLEFQEDRIKGLYENEQKVAQTVTIGVIIILIISSMGLFALSLYESERRMKEIAIRKINGATTHNLVLLLSSDFTKWVILAFILACPISYYFMNKWLENFIYQTLISWWIFLATGLLTLFITWITISFQSIKAARRNPVISLRND